ncbi:glycosyltransferase family 4 protein [Rahnella sikkimica]|uniref:Glycosyl transferase family 1 domain-containing protein n=1 Tax=Rahnella sikkimica TaxID=1805933 RepID=A0A2L1UVP8_9GAMM|nr:glycosyltransferase family 1 protein [Rahnella sikkimica]AVF37023.1 hypothetical protein BV494_19845 [Rahnella sikkimica]
MKERDPRLYIDCTSTFRSGLNTGVQRVVRALIKEVKTFSEITQLDCIPICYQFNGFYTLEDAQNITLDTLADFKAVDFNFKDVYLCPDAFWSYGMTSWFDYFRDQGVRIATVVYDLIPIVNPEFCDAAAIKEFESALLVTVKKSDILFTISKSTRRDLIEYCSSIGEDLDKERCLVIPLAPALQADKENIDSKRLPDEPFFLMVGTVEPRRGYIEAISEYQAYLAAGGNSSLLIIGKEGGSSEEVIRSISQTSNKVKWLTNASDAELMSAYQKALAVICPSKSEGYGMSVSEGLAYNGLVLANRLPVFGEFAGSSPYYFDIGRKGDLARLLGESTDLTHDTQASDMGTWSNTAKTIASEIVKISPSHGRHKAIELRKNSEEAIRWAYWLLFDRQCSAEEVENWLKFEKVQDMYDALQYESRTLGSPLGKDSIRWLQLVINERDAVDNDEVEYWLSQYKSVEELRNTLMLEHYKLDAPVSKLFMRWALTAYFGETNPPPEEFAVGLEGEGTNRDFLTKIRIKASIN